MSAPAALDYTGVNRYWDTASSSILGSYMMDGFGFPTSAGHFRFQAESRIVQRLIHSANVDTGGAVLDLGSGVGYWAEYLAKYFGKVVAVEASAPLYESLVQRCSPYSNVLSINTDVLSFEPKDRFSLIFLGGILMYLNECDVINLLQKVTSYLKPNGVILCRESTVRNGTVTRKGTYQAVYRSVKTYTQIFNQGGLAVAKVDLNAPYVLMQMGCEFIKKWQATVSGKRQGVSAMGFLTYWGLRSGYPWITRLPAKMGIAFPDLTNHFFMLRKGCQKPSRNNDVDFTN